MALLSTLYVGQSGLSAANAGIQATSQNVSNALTPGYNRRSVDQSLGDPVRTGGLLLGQGAQVDGIVRTTDRILAMRRLSEAGELEAASALHTNLELLESSFSEANTDSLRDLYDAAFSGLDALTIDPSSLASRQDALANFEQFATRVRNTVDELTAGQQGFVAGVQGALPDVNASLQEIADLNERIVAAGGDNVAPDLADRRDVLLRGLAESVGATATLSADGQATVMIGGHAVVNGHTARALSLDVAPNEPPALRVSAGSGWLDVTSAAGGTLGGQLQAWQAAEGYLDELDTFAQGFADAMNAQHQAGFDANGNAGTDLFSVDPNDPAATLSLSAAVSDDPQLLALSSSNDPAAVGNVDNLVALLALEEDSTLTGSGISLGEQLTNLSAQVGRDVADAERASNQQSAVVEDLDSLADSLNGVDLDEEAANLVAYQAAYQAAARVITTADTLLSSLMELV